MIRHTMIAALLLAGAIGTSTAREAASGVVFEDLNRNGLREADEPGVPNVPVSNQIEVVLTDEDGRWDLPVREDCTFFVVKPRGWMTPVNSNNLPQFYYIHKPDGSPAFKYAGVPPTGELPASIDFALHRQPEPDQFKAIFFADPQARDQRELNFIAHDVVEELIGTDARFGVTLGDILFDDLSLFENHNALIALIGIPWYNVIGNHDINFDAADDRHSDETFERFYGPSYYAYTHGPAHFIVLDNVVWGGRKPGGSGTYTSGLGGKQLAFIGNLLPHIPEDELLVLMMHIPIIETVDARELFKLIEDRPYTLSISGHTHWQAHHFLGEADGWHGREPHHHVVNVTVSGSWWSGEPDETGIPHTTMRDGAPNGYSIITFDGHRATVDFKAARRPASYQMNIHAPEVVKTGEAQTNWVYVNVFGGSKKSSVSMKIDSDGDWIDLERVAEPDPYFRALKVSEQGRTLVNRKLPEPVRSGHLWKAALPEMHQPGVHRIWVRTEDHYGRAFDASRVIRVEKTSEARRALARATSYLTSISTEGGYLWRYSEDLTERRGEERATETQVWVQSPGTPAVGEAFLDAYRATGDTLHLEAAQAAAMALARGQLDSGGWDYRIEFDPEARRAWAYRLNAERAGSGGREAKNTTTFDDDNTQGALRFLMAFLDATTNRSSVDVKMIRECAEYGLAKMIEAQYPNGAWPQRWAGQSHDRDRHPVKRAHFRADWPRTWPRSNYSAFYTLNDGAQLDCITTMIEASHRLDDPRYLEAAKRGGDFLILARLPEPQPGWAQQYNFDMEPAWARAFEPAAVCSSESAVAMRLLVDLFLETGDDKYLEPIPAFLGWLERSRLGPDRWARLYELGSNKPIYGDRDGIIHYTLAEISAERQRGYAWEGSFGIPEALERYKEVLRLGREAYRQQSQDRAQRSVPSAARVARVIEQQDEQGRWWSNGWVDMRRFIFNMRQLAAFVEVEED